MRLPRGTKLRLCGRHSSETVELHAAHVGMFEITKANGVVSGYSYWFCGADPNNEPEAGPLYCIKLEECQKLRWQEVGF